MSNQLELEFLSHDSWHQILAAHNRYTESGGKEGQIADLSAYEIEDFDFSGLDLSSINARGSVFTRCRFIGCDLYGVNFNDSSLVSSDFRESNLGKVEFYNVDASGACFDNANMGSAEFYQANLRGATFHGTNLRGSSFSDCDLTNAIFNGANLEYASVTNNKEDRTSWADVKGMSAANTKRL